MSKDAMKAAIEKAKQPAAAPAPQKPKKMKPPRRPEARDRAMEAKGRLPEGSSFTVAYSEKTGKPLWTGSLYIRVSETNRAQDYKIFEGEASGVFKLLTVLDDKYRAWLKEREAKC